MNGSNLVAEAGRFTGSVPGNAASYNDTRVLGASPGADVHVSEIFSSCGRQRCVQPVKEYCDRRGHVERTGKEF